MLSNRTCAKVFEGPSSHSARYDMEKNINYNEMTQTTCEELLFGLNRVKITIAEIHKDECFGERCSKNNDCNKYIEEIEEAIEVVREQNGIEVI